MNSAITAYISEINARLKSGHAKEHAYRPAFCEMVKALVKGIDIINEPVKITDCGNPDFVVTRGGVPIGFIEAKDVGDDLASSRHEEQFNRYRKALDNLIITNYIHFQFFSGGKIVHEISIAERDGDKVKPLPAEFERFGNLFKSFCDEITQTINSPGELSKMMAGKARLLKNILENALTEDEKNNESNADLMQQYQAFRKVLINDLTLSGFADIYAQTLAYGMFAARLHDTSPTTFSRSEAVHLIPKSNPFLRRLFEHVAGANIDSRIEMTVDNLADVFRHANIDDLFKHFGKKLHSQDPIIHFYETFLAEYDPKLRKSRGVWYTPPPIVNFIVRAVDDMLKNEFALPEGLAHTGKTKITVSKQDGRTTEKKEVHTVQILDPATGTGTFLAEVVNHIYHKNFTAMKGAWGSYVDEHLIPRLNGFELLMASYAMAHLKLDMLLSDTGYQVGKSNRLNVYLTNALEEHHPDTETLFTGWLSQEANEANRIKRDTPVMCVIGNPPYSGISANDGKWIGDLIEHYKYVDGVHFNERKHWLNDDYVKFMRYGQHLIEKNGKGVLAFINPHGFLDNPTFRGMRWNLLKTYDKIYIIDLHGNSKKREKCPDGSPDYNVFDIQQGVSINILIKTGKKKSGALGQVFHKDLYGTRESKYQFLYDNNLASIDFKPIKNNASRYSFVPSDEKHKRQYEKGFRIDDFFASSVTGVVTARDSVVIDMDKEKLLNRIEKFTDTHLTDEEIRHWLFPNKKDGKYLAGDSRGWKLTAAREKIADNNHPSFIKEIAYRPFDTRAVYYSPDMVDWGREKFMRHFLDGENVGLVFARQSTDANWTGVQIVNTMIDNRFHFSYKGIPQQAPLYLYPENGQQSLAKTKRTPNLNPDIVRQIEQTLGLDFTSEKKAGREAFAPIDLLDYIYAALHSPTYRRKYKEFLKIDFPRVPYPQDAESFWQMVNLGKQLRQIHLLENLTVKKSIANYALAGDNEVEKIKYSNEKVHINATQYFENVPATAWEFSIGGYQPAQKWLKDRAGEKLSYDDLLHYQKIITVLIETDLTMKKIEEIEKQFAR